MSFKSGKGKFRAAGGKIKEGAKKVNNNLGILKSKYRTSVLYDFSTVTKATFHIFKITSETINGLGSAAGGNIGLIFNSMGGFQFNRKFEYIEPLPVQINPSDIRMNSGAALPDYARVKRGQDNPLPESLDGGNVHVVGKEVSTTPATLEIDLDYDIYDDYMVATGDGAAHIPSLKQPLSLLSGDCVSLRKLCEYSCQRDYYALFEWGDVRFFGIIDNVNTQYNAFSSKGTPLKAHANVNMSEQILSTSDGLKNDPLTSGCIEFTDIGKVKSYQTSLESLSTAQMVLSLANR